MKVFVAGATGALGRQLVPMLVAGNHEVAEMRDEVAAQVAAVVLDRRALALLDRREVLDVSLARLGDGRSLGPANHDELLLHAATQLGLGLCPGQTVARARGPLGAESALHTSLSCAPEAIPGLGPVGIRADDERPLP
jgi:hypothetical protein